MTLDVSSTDTLNIFGLKYDDIKDIFTKLYLPELKDIGNKNQIRGYSVACKADLVNLIFAQYDKWRSLLCKIKYKELLALCIKYKLIIDDCRGLTKDMFVHILISAVYIKNKIIKHHIISEPELSENEIENISKYIEEYGKQSQSPKENVSIPEEDINTIDKKTIILSEIDQAKQKLDELIAEKTRQDELIKKQEKLLEKEKKRIEEETTKQLIETLKAEKAAAKAEKKKLEEELEKQKKLAEEIAALPPQYEETQTTTPAPAAPSVATNQRRRPLPACVRDSVWNHYIGEDINKHRCLCCKQVKINNREFQVGHVISVRDGGTDEINNLRPICAPCNHSMGTKNMIEFVKTYGYYIG